MYNRYGRRDNKYKARIKILVKALTPAVFAERVNAEWAHLKDGPTTLTDAEVARVAAHFFDPSYKALDDQDAALAALDAEHPGFARWRQRNTFAPQEAWLCRRDPDRSSQPAWRRAMSPTSSWM